MPLTRDQLNEVTSVANVAIKQLCTDDNFIKTLADTVAKTVINNLTAKLVSFETELNGLKTEINELKILIADKDRKHKEEMDSLKQEINIQQIVAEVNEIKYRENNCLIFGIPENTPNLSNTTMEIIKKVIPDVNENQITFSRVGKSVPLNNKNRPVKVVLPNKDDALRLIKNNKLIKSIFKDIYIRPDNTVKQREYYLKLRNELNERIANGETNLYIKYFHGLPKITAKNM